MRLFRIVLVLTACLIIAGIASAQTSKGSEIIENFEYPELTWSVPEVGEDVIRQELENGMILYMMEDHSLPLFRISALIRCGSAYVPMEQMEIPSMVGTIMRSGGTTMIDADSLNFLLESMGASVETWIGEESGGANLSVLSKDIEFGIEIMADVLRNPAFPEDKIDLQKEQIKTSIKRRNDSPGSINYRYFYHTLYGDHPSGRILEWEYVKPITRPDLVAYHEQWFTPDRMMLAVTGDFDPQQVVALIEKHFGNWEAGGDQAPQVPEVQTDPQPGVFLIEKDINQSNILIGHMGITEDNPDRYAVQVMNYILGGGSFTSRMTSKVRSDEGLAYSVGSRYSPGTEVPGLFMAYCQTKSETTHRAIDLMMAEIERIRQDMVSDDELQGAKDSYINRYIFNFTSASEIVMRLMELEFNDRPRDLLQSYIENIRSVTRDDVLRVAQEYLKPEQLTIMVVGKQKDFDQPLDAFGPVSTINVPEPVVD